MTIPKYSITALKSNTGIITAYINELPGIVCEANTEAEARSKLKDIFYEYQLMMSDALEIAEYTEIDYKD